MIRTSAPLPRPHRLAACGLLALLVTGCGDKDVTAVTPAPGPSSRPPPEMMTASSNGGGTSALDEPLYAISATTFTTEGLSSYVALVPGLDATTEIDYGRTLELPGGGRIWGSTEVSNAFFVVDDERATVTRYEVDAEDRFREIATLSFGNFGITAFNPSSGTRLDVVSERKAYFFDGITTQAIAFDPSDMTLLGDLDLSGLARDGWPTAFGFAPTLRRGSELVVFTFYEDQSGQQHAPELRLALIDTESDTVTIVTDDRCPATYATMNGAGDIYFASDGRAAAYHRVRPEATSEPCLLRLLADERALDSAFRIALSDLTDGGATGGFVPADGDGAYLLTLDEELAPVAAGTLAGKLYNARAWRWWRVELGETAPGTPSEVLEPTAGGTVYMRIGDEWYTNESAADYSETVLLRTTVPGDPVAGIRVRGVPINILRMR